MIDFIDEKSLYGAAAKDGRSKIETTQKLKKTSWISEQSHNNHRSLPEVLGWLAVKFLSENKIIGDKYRTNILFRSRST